MSEKRNITKEDIQLRDRMMGAGAEVKGPLLFKQIGSMGFNGVRIVVEGQLKTEIEIVEWFTDILVHRSV